jgi:hypothetical protein
MRCPEKGRAVYHRHCCNSLNFRALQPCVVARFSTHSACERKGSDATQRQENFHQKGEKQHKQSQIRQLVEGSGETRNLLPFDPFPFVSFGFLRVRCAWLVCDQALFRRWHGRPAWAGCAAPWRFRAAPRSPRRLRRQPIPPAKPGHRCCRAH